MKSFSVLIYHQFQNKHKNNVDLFNKIERKFSLELGLKSCSRKLKLKTIERVSDPFSRRNIRKNVKIKNILKRDFLKRPFLPSLIGQSAMVRYMCYNKRFKFQIRWHNWFTQSEYLKCWLHLTTNELWNNKWWNLWIPGRHCGLMASSMDFGANGPESIPGRGIALCSWARHFTLTVPFSTQLYKWVRQIVGAT